MRYLSITMLVILFLSLQPISAQEQCIPASDDHPITIGAVFSGGGLLTAASGDALAGATTMLQAINACGGANGHMVQMVTHIATNRDTTEAAVADLTSQGVTLIVGSGNAAISSALSDLAEDQGFIHWEISESLTDSGEWSYSPRPTHTQLGQFAGAFVQSDIQPLLDGNLNTALIYESRDRASSIANGVINTLGSPVIIREYSDTLSSTSSLAVDIRELGIDAVLLSAFDDDARRLWFALREADANPIAWIQLGSDGYRRSLCSRTSVEGFISVTAHGAVSERYRRDTLGDLYTAYQQHYLAEYSSTPSPTADLSASGMVMLVHHVLPHTVDLSIESLRATLNTINIPIHSGMMGEGLSFIADLETGRIINEFARPVISQQQGGRLCSITSEALRTCQGGVIPFPTWLERQEIERNGNFCIGTET